MTWSLTTLWRSAVSRSGPELPARVARRRRKVQESGYFDSDWYLLEYPDVRREGLEPLRHFLEHGDREGRSPGLQFDSHAYTVQHPEVRISGLGPFEHFLRVGRAAGYRPPPFASDYIKKCKLRAAVQRSGFFDADWYHNRYPDIRRNENDALTHFAFFGLLEGRDPGPNFNTMTLFLRKSETGDIIDSALEFFQRSDTDSGAATSAYGAWLEVFDALTDDDRSLIRQDITEASFAALTIIHVFDSSACSFVEQIIAGYQSQIFEDWAAQIVFAEDVSDAKQQVVRAFAARDPRISVQTDAAGATAVADRANYIVLISGGVLLQPYALYLMIVHAAESGAKFVYTDHDEVDGRGGRHSPAMKPQFSPELLRSRFYIGPCLLIRNCAPNAHLSLDVIVEDLRRRRCDELVAVLRHATFRDVAHAPYAAWTLLDGDVKLGFERAEAMSRCATPLVSIVIATRDRIELLRDCIESIERKTDYPRDRLEFVIVDNDSQTTEATRYFADLGSRIGFRILCAPGEFNFARLYNLGASGASGEVVILLNNDMTVIDPQWISKMIAQCLQPDVACVGAKLLYPDDTIQHAGCVLGVSGLAAHRLLGRPASSVRDIDFTREISAVTGACIAIRRRVFNELGGLNEGLRIAFNDIDFCIAAQRRGFRNIYICDPLLYHFESKSRGLDTTRAKIELNAREAAYARQRNPEYFQNDPYYSPNLSLERGDELAFPPRRDKPWLRRVKTRTRKVLMLTSTMAMGHGVAVVVRMQARRLLREGYEVIIAGPESEQDYVSEGWARIILSQPMIAAIAAVRENVDCVIAHTPPFFSVGRFLGPTPKLYFYDYGEPDPDLFDDRDARADINWEKRFCVPSATRVLAISQAIKDQSVYPGVEVLRIANSHMAFWSTDFVERRRRLRREMGWEGQFVVLNVCRFTQAERRYKGVDKYADLAKEFWFACPEAQGRTTFVLAGKATSADVMQMEDQGLSVFANVSDEFMAALYAASDMYVNFSKWEGYNLGIGQALAMGLSVIASDIPAHREFPVFTTDSLRLAIEELGRQFDQRSEDPSGRRPVVYDWDESTGKLLDMLRSDLH